MKQEIFQKYLAEYLYGLKAQNIEYTNFIETTNKIRNHFLSYMIYKTSISEVQKMTGYHIVYLNSIKENDSSLYFGGSKTVIVLKAVNKLIEIYNRDNETITDFVSFLRALKMCLIVSSSDSEDLDDTTNIHRKLGCSTTTVRDYILMYLTKYKPVKKPNPITANTFKKLMDSYISKNITSFCVSDNGTTWIYYLDNDNNKVSQFFDDNNELSRFLSVIAARTFAFTEDHKPSDVLIGDEVTLANGCKYTVTEEIKRSPLFEATLLGSTVKRHV